MNSKTIAVIRREFVTRVHTKSFIIGTVLVPVMFLVMIGAMVLIMGQQAHTSRVAVLDGSGSGIGQQVARVLGAQKLGSGPDAQPRYDISVVPANGNIEQARRRLIDQTGFSSHSSKGKYDGVLVLPADVLKSGKVEYYGNNVSSPEAMGKLSDSLTKILAAKRLAAMGVDIDTVSRAMRPVDLSSERVAEGKLTGQSGHAAFAVAYGMGFLLYLAIILYGSRTMTSVIEEKNSRVMEVLVSSLTPFQMLMGKVLGVGAVGLFQMAIWVVSAFVIASQAPHLAAAFGSNPAAVSHLIPSISGSLIVIFLLYFALGFLLYGALFAAVGSMCNSIHDTQQYSFVVTIPILIGFFSAFSIISHPTGSFGRIMSWIPFFSPFTMPVRWSLTAVPGIGLVGSLVLMVLVLLGCVWLAARIYHTGILMFGKKPTWRELWRWIRVS